MNRTSALLLSCAALLASAPSALAATPNITGDDGSVVPITQGMALRHMAPEVSFTFGANEQYYAARVVGPAGPASSGTDCVRTSSPFGERVEYQGNGVYTLFLKTADTFDACKAATEQSFPFTISAGTSVLPPPSQPLLTRAPDASNLNPFDVPVSLNPGADAYELKYARNATIGPDGGIVGEAQSGFVNVATGRASITFSEPGRYTFVVRAKSFRSDVPTAWSPRLDVVVVAPFDVNLTRFPDSRGPTYSLSGSVKESTATGKVTISIGKGWKPKKFRRLGVAKLRKGARFKLKFRLTKPGKYTLRYSYKGGPTVAAGTDTEPIQIRRRFF